MQVGDWQLQAAVAAAEVQLVVVEKYVVLQTLLLVAEVVYAFGRIAAAQQLAHVWAVEAVHASVEVSCDS